MSSPKPIDGYWPFDPEYFMMLLLWQAEGLTTKAEDRYIALELSRNDAARQALADVRETFPCEKFPKKKRSLSPVWIAAIGFILVGSVALSLGRYNAPVDTVEINRVQNFQNVSLQQLITLIEQVSQAKIVIDSVELSSYHFSGVMDLDRPVEDLLNLIQASSGQQIHYSKDSGGIYHLY
jgi:hypothetical protein